MGVTKIEWADYTFNPWIGCTKVAAGCEHCYAEALAKRTGLAQWGPRGTRVKTSPEYWRQPIKWNKAAARENVRRRVFCASLADVFEEWYGHVLSHHGEVIADCRNCGFSGVIGHDPGAGNFCGKCGSGAINVGSLHGTRRNLFALIDATPHLDWLLLTKRPENIAAMWPETAAGGRWRENVWLGTSIATQADAERNIPHLLVCRDLASVLFVSAEPLLGPIDLNLYPSGIQHGDDLGGNLPSGDDWVQQIDWLIVGGESGPKARPMHPDLVRSLRDQCQAAGVPFFFKQWGEWAPYCKELSQPMAARGGLFSGNHYVRWNGWEWVPNRLSADGNQVMLRVGKARAGRLLDGREWSEFPAERSAGQCPTC